MDLNGNLSGERNCGVLFCVVNGFHAIDPQLNARPLTANAVIIPVIFPENLHQLFEVGPGEDLAAARLVVQRAPILLTEICLIADHFMMVRDSLTTDLNAGICVVSTQSKLQPQFKVTEVLFVTQKEVVRNAFFELSTDDGFVFDSKDGLVSVPRRKGAAVKKRTKSVLVITGCIRRCKQSKEDRRNDKGRRVSNWSHWLTFKAVVAGLKCISWQLLCPPESDQLWFEFLYM